MKFECVCVKHIEHTDSDRDTHADRQTHSNSHRIEHTRTRSDIECEYFCLSRLCENECDSFSIENPHTATKTNEFMLVAHAYERTISYFLAALSFLED